MATYSSSAYTNNAPAKSYGVAGSVLVMTATVSCTAAPSTSDTLNFFTMPKNSRVHFAVLKADDMDTNVSPTITLNIGDSGSASRLFAASTVAQAGTLSTAIAAGGEEYQYAADTVITGTAANNAATGAAGTVTLTVFYTLEGGAS
jgi:hypothetical protein